MQEIPIYLFTGFMDSGKTTLIKETLLENGFADQGKSLIICCEDGEVEYDEAELKKINASLVMVENEEDFTADFLNAINMKYLPDQVFIEYNGTWGMDTLTETELPRGWMVVQSLATVDATTFDMYLANMRTMIMEQLFQADVVIFNRCDDSTDKGKYRRNVKALNRKAQLVYERADGSLDEREEELPFDIQPMTPPAASDGKRYLSIAYQHDNVPGWGIVCSSQTEHPELLAAYMDQVVSPFGRDIFNYGVEGVTYDIVDGKPVMKEGIDKAEMGVGTQYEVWMVGMGPDERNGGGYLLSQAAIDLSTENFNSGNVEAVWPPVHTLFSTEAGEQKANIENTLKTYVDEQEAMFIYGQRSMSEWDAFVEEVNNLIDVQELLDLYNNAETILRDSPRVFQAS